jgi:hypothetical protein
MCHRRLKRLYQVNFMQTFSVSQSFSQNTVFYIRDNAKRCMFLYPLADDPHTVWKKSTSVSSIKLQIADILSYNQ